MAVKITEDFENELLKDFELKNLINSSLKQQEPIIPEGGFVIKTKLLKAESLNLCKLFINLCHSERIPVNLLDNYQNDIKSGEFKLPLSSSSIRTDVDKQGSVCYVVDAAINTQAYKLTVYDPDFKQFVVDLCVAWVSEKHSCELGSPTLPKMVCKGKLVPHLINRPQRPTIEEVETGLSKSNNDTSNLHTPQKGISISNVNSLEKPNYAIEKEPKVGSPKVLSVKIHLPREENIDFMELDLEESAGEYKLLFSSKYYTLDLVLDSKVDMDLASNSNLNH